MLAFIFLSVFREHFFVTAVFKGIRFIRKKIILINNNKVRESKFLNNRDSKLYVNDAIKVDNRHSKVV